MRLIYLYIIRLRSRLTVWTHKHRRYFSLIFVVVVFYHFIVCCICKCKFVDASKYHLRNCEALERTQNLHMSSILEQNIVSCAFYRFAFRILCIQNGNGWRYACTLLVMPITIYNTSWIANLARTGVIGQKTRCIYWFFGSGAFANMETSIHASIGAFINDCFFLLLLFLQKQISVFK